VAGAVMSKHEAFRRAAVPQQVAQRLETITIPAPTRGIIMNENEAYTQPGAAVFCDNWKPTMKGVSLRGGCERWCVLPDAVPVVSAFEYASGNNQRMYAGQLTKLWDVTTGTPVLIKSGQTSGNYSASQLANANGDWMLVLNDAGDAPLRYNGTDWEVLIPGYVPPAGKPSTITGPAGSAVVNGQNLTYVCKYRNRFFFIEANSMNAWYLGIDAVGGALNMIPLSGAASRGGKLLFCATWSIDAGNGIDDKLVFATNLGEILVFTGSNPGDAANWRQEGRYEMSPPLGMNAHIAVGGDLLVATVDGILPTSGAITKDRAELELAAITRNIKPMWREEVLDKREHPWTMKKWDEYGGIFTTFPGGMPGKYRCLVTNAATGAHTRFTGWDAMCFIRMRGDCFFGTQNGIIMQMDRTGKDDGNHYVATLVGGWEMFQAPSQTLTWRQARASFTAKQGEPFQPQLSCTTDFVVVIPQPPPIGDDPGILDLWDEGLWGPLGSSTPNPPPPADVDTYAQWDAGVPFKPVARNTMWVSIGQTGFSHAPIVQVTVSQQAKPVVDLIAIAATFEKAGVNV
jgi:hypothetical protein